MDVSVVSGTFNRLPYLKKMVRSVRDSCAAVEGFRHELVLVDGGSTDGTLEWLRGQPDVRLVEHGDLKGAVKAFNDGAHAARGQYIIMANDDIEFINLVESLGATFVVDDHCTGSRYFWNEVEPQEDRLMAIAERYVNRPACPTKDWPDRNRVKHVLQLAKDYNVQGAIMLQQKFCDPHELDIPALKKSFQEADIPTLFLELDVTVPVGQFKIRSEAFLEMLREEDLF